MNILVTGNQGYIGMVMAKMLSEKGYQVTGLDAGFYSGCQFGEADLNVRQIKKDIRKVSLDDLENIDAIMHLAGISNDPLGVFVPELTDEINVKATVRLAKMAKEKGVKRFIYASSCSIYGVAGNEPLSESGKIAPVTAYAISKANSEKALSELADGSFSPVYLRPGTAYGVSPMLRCDLVVNNLTGWAFTTGKIKIMSDGTPWRPVIHVEDFCRGFIACLEAPIELVHNQPFNLSQNSENYQIREIAEAVKEAMPECAIEYTGEHGVDSRTYRVNFDKINTDLKDFFRPEWNLKKGVRQICETFKLRGLTYEEFAGNKYVRLNHLKKLISEKKIDANLFWR